MNNPPEHAAGESVAGVGENGVASERRPPLAGRRRRWAFRTALLLVTPLLALVGLEVGLRLGGFGYPTSFFLRVNEGGRDLLIQNNQFGWRFFGARRARLPHPFALETAKPQGTVRIFVFGESAAKGEPQPQFGLPRMLQALLSLRHPGVRFEVVNAAMTGINSHVILPIARDCANADGDIWVLCMGNNEVVGPFGAGTVFGGQSPLLPVIRASVSLKATRTGQWLDMLRDRLQGHAGDTNEWRGMKMFLDHRVATDDSRMPRVYSHFASNLAEIIETGQRAGAAVVFSTLPVNLRDCAPFASVHRKGLTDADRTQWQHFYNTGVAAQHAGDFDEAEARFNEAAALDEGFAEMRFRQGEVALALGKLTDAQQHFIAARDLDALRFRCDSRLNELTRQAVTNAASARVRLADSERALAELSPDGLPGSALFYEHAHLTFEGNYWLARTIAVEVEKLLPSQLAGAAQPDGDWPSMAECAQRMAWTDLTHLAALSSMLARIKQPPFTDQFDQSARVFTMTARIKKLEPANSPAGLAVASVIAENALAEMPGDADLWTDVARLRQMRGDLNGAEAAWRRVTELRPGDATGWANLDDILRKLNRPDEAEAANHRAAQLDLRPSSRKAADDTAPPEENR